MWKCVWKVGLVLFLLLPLSFLPSALAAESLCGPTPVLALGEYCTFHPFIKIGEDDAIIMLSWGAMGPGMQGVPTPSMIGEYYFYFKEGKLYYLGNTTGLEEIRYTFHNGLWYLSDARAVDPEGPCILGNVIVPRELWSEGNIPLGSPSYPVILNGSRLYVSTGETSYTITVPGNRNFISPATLPCGRYF